MVVVVPLTVKSPVTTKPFLTVVVPVVAPIVTAVPAANKAGDVGVSKKEVEPTVASTDVRPAIVVLEAPNAIAVVPTVTELFAKLAFVIPAVPLKLLLVKPLIVFEPAAIVLFVNVSVPARVARVPVVGRVNVVAAVAVSVVLNAPAVAKVEPLTKVNVPVVDETVKPLMLVAAATPRVGVTKVGLVANTAFPVPVTPENPTVSTDHPAAPLPAVRSMLVINTARPAITVAVAAVFDALT